MTIFLVPLVALFLPLSHQLRVGSRAPRCATFACRARTALAQSASDAFSPQILTRLRLHGKCAVVFFIEQDTSFDCAKELQAFHERAQSFEAYGCSLVAVRPPGGADKASAERYPSLTFVEDDAEEALKVWAGLVEKDWLGRTPARGTFVIAANGTVCGTVTAEVEAQAHAAYALRLLLEDEAAVKGAAEALKPSIADMREMVAKQLAPTAAEQAAADVIRELDRQQALRAQALFAGANSRAFYSFGDFTSTLDREIASEAVQAAERARMARLRKLAARAALRRAEAVADERAVKSARDDAEQAAAAELRAAEDELSMLRKQLEGIRAPINKLRGIAEGEEAQGTDLARRAYSLRAKATRALLAVEEEVTRSQMRAALAQWADEEAESRAAADGYRAAVEAAWSQSMGEGERRDERAAEAKQAADRAAVRAADALSPAAPDDVRRFSARAPPPQSTRQVRELVEAAAQEERQARSYAERARQARERAEQAQTEYDVKWKICEGKAIIVDRMRRGKEGETEEGEGEGEGEEPAEAAQAALEAAMIRTEATSANRAKAVETVGISPEAFKRAIVKKDQEVLAAASAAQRAAPVDAAPATAPVSAPAATVRGSGDATSPIGQPAPPVPPMSSPPTAGASAPMARLTAEQATLLALCDRIDAAAASGAVDDASWERLAAMRGERTDLLGKMLRASRAEYLRALELLAERIVPLGDFPTVDGVPMASVVAVQTCFPEDDAARSTSNT
jgi:peroxiredoxin